MNETIFNIVGWIATVLAITMFFPQTLKVIKLKETKSLSLSAFTCVAVGVGFWVIAAPMLHSYQGYATNAAISLLLIPIFFYLLKDKRNIFYIYVTMVFVVIGVGILLFVLNLKISIYIRYCFVIAASSGTVFWTIPQIIIIFKTKKVVEYSLMSGLLILLSNLLWVIYWIDKSIISSGSDIGVLLIPSISSIGGVLTQLPIFYIYLKYNPKKEVVV